jgi:hypothetical protein
MPKIWKKGLETSFSILLKSNCCSFFLFVAASVDMIVWDHAKHQDMHYGEGFKKEAIKHAKKTAEREGAFEYHSPLGRGFTFAQNEPLHGHTYNPYSKRSQGPPRVTFEYEEASNMGEQWVSKKDKIVEEMHQRRAERHNNGQPQQQRYASASNGGFHTQEAAASARHRSGSSSNECIIL